MGDSGMVGSAAAPGEVTLPTPEGVPLRFPLARVGDRIFAFFVDLLIIGAAGILLVFAVSSTSDGFATALFFVLFFLLRNFYFLISETVGRGASLGKRWQRIHVVDGKGGPLDARSVVVRNLMREVDTFLPLTVIPLVPVVWPDAPRALALLVLVWMFAVMLLPIFDRKRRRLGDLVAGTLVLAAPERHLLPDLADTEEERETTYTFTDEQLGKYGIYELQVLERVLRQDDPIQGVEARATVAEAIRAKIAWTGGPVHTRRFLTDFYAALRADLERRMLLGDRREDKRAAARRGQPSPADD